MDRGLRRLVLILVVTAGAALPAAAQNAASSENAIPADPNASFRVAVSAFRGEGLSPDNEYLTQSIPLLLLQTISALSHHHFDPSELAAYRRSVLSAAVSEQQSQINTLLNQRATILFQSSDPAKALAASTTSIDAARRRLKFLQDLNPDLIPVEGDKPIEVVRSQSGEPLVSYPLLSPGYTAKELKLGELVWGSVAQVADYLVVQIDVYSSSYGEDIYKFQKVYSASNVLDAAAQAADRVAASVLGREFGNVTFEVTPSSALLYVDGRFYGVGSATIRYLTTGEHKFELRAPGYRTREVAVSVSPFSDTKESIELEPVPGRELVVSSVPAGADVYLASVWQGTTPLILSRPSEDEALVLHLAGYHDYTTTITSAAPARLDIRLRSDVFDSRSYISHIRNRFYASFGAFALSLALPVSFYSLSQEYLANAQLTTNTQEFDRLKSLIGVWYYSYLGGAFVSSALFANTIIDIVSYLRAIR